MHRERHVHDHFVVDELVLFGKHQKTVERENAPELERLEHVDALKVALKAHDLAVDFDRKAHVLGVLFGKYKVHACLPSD
ncbi:hypothetical protein SDC9_187734 [bioreactor metagenome]|uniref:Uncharacterized protein n=1 Tax=bioreactor metagenome TaxID=1076179 RepID=A0A645HMC4_9ZZZZ